MGLARGCRQVHIARELSKIHREMPVVIDREEDVCNGTSQSQTVAIYPPVVLSPQTLAYAQGNHFNVSRGTFLWDEPCKGSRHSFLNESGSSLFVTKEQVHEVWMLGKTFGKRICQPGSCGISAYSRT